MQCHADQHWQVDADDSARLTARRGQLHVPRTQPAWTTATHCLRRDYRYTAFSIYRLDLLQRF